jgi:hypothetical protein
MRQSYAHGKSNSHGYADSYTHGNGDRHVYADSDCHGNCHIHSDSDRDGNRYIHSDSDCDGNVYADCNCNCNSYSYSYSYSYSNCDRIAAVYTDATATTDAAASSLALFRLRGTRENELASSQPEVDRPAAAG